MASTVDVAALRAWVVGFAGLVTAEKDHLTELDAAIGDADHGANMARGMAAVVAALDGEGADPAAVAAPDALMKKVGMTLVSTVGGASGPLFGTLFLRMGPALGGGPQVAVEQVGAALRAGLEGVVARGKAQPGEKTMVDALAPAVDAFDSALGADDGALTGALTAARDAAAAGRDATIPMQAHKGRASYLGERSIGHQDPGATTVVLLLDAALDALG